MEFWVVPNTQGLPTVNAAAIVGEAGGGAPKRIVAFGQNEVPGTFTYDVPEDVKTIVVEVVGGGGGGAARNGTDSGCGAGGGYARSVLTNLAKSYEVVVGAGGVGGTAPNDDATNGALSSFGDAQGLSIVGQGGGRGRLGGAGSNGGFGAGADADFTVQGGSGSNGGAAGKSGTSFFGGGVRSGDSAGGNGTAWGNGGAGVHANNGNGGDGQIGQVVITEF